MKSAFSKIISLDEMKISVLVVMFLFSMGVGTYSTIFYGDIPTNLTNIIICIVASISGLNAMLYFGKTNSNLPQNPDPPEPIKESTTERAI